MNSEVPLTAPKTALPVMATRYRLAQEIGGVSAARIYRLEKAGLLKAAARDASGAPLFDLAQIAALRQAVYSHIEGSSPTISC